MKMTDLDGRRCCTAGVHVCQRMVSALEMAKLSKKLDQAWYAVYDLSDKSSDEFTPDHR